MNFALGFNVLRLEFKKVAGQRPGIILQKPTIAYARLLIIFIFDARHGIVYFIYSDICLFFYVLITYACTRTTSSTS